MAVMNKMILCVKNKGCSVQDEVTLHRLSAINYLNATLACYSNLPSTCRLVLQAVEGVRTSAVSLLLADPLN